MKNYTIISDPGIDDLVALTLLYKIAPNISHNLIATYGNASEEITSINAKEFISFIAKNWRFENGSMLPFNGVIEMSWPDYFHGPDGVWGVHPNVNIYNVREIITDYSDVISLATLTDPLKLLQKNKISKITLMGGAFEIGGNETKYAETNIAFDPDAAKYFFEKIDIVKTRVVPLDVTRKVYWSEEKVRSIPEVNEINIWLKKLLLSWFEKYIHDKEKDFNLHDPLAVFLNFFPDMAKWDNRGVEVIVKGKKRGQTIFTNKNPQCEIAMDLVDPKKISEEIFAKIFGKVQ